MPEIQVSSVSDYILGSGSYAEVTARLSLNGDQCVSAVVSSDCPTNPIFNSPSMRSKSIDKDPKETES